MLISKFNLYNAEWLDVVFANRNKEYGAYYLRQSYAGNLVKAMLITFFSVTCAAVFFGLMIRTKPEVIFKKTEVVLQSVAPPKPPKEEPKKAEVKPSKPQPPQATKQFLVMTPTDKLNVVEPPKLSDLQNVAVGPVEIKVPGSGPAINVDPDAGKGTGISPVEDKTIYLATTIEVMPEPFGGVNGWTKFLQKNLRYPPQATDKGVGGKVWISFIIEKDGHLSDITVLRGPGFGMDEEALRVLKLAPAWKPGIQNGQNVRVKYTIPINFSMGE
jgi:protein TonB